MSNVPVFSFKESIYLLTISDPHYGAPTHNGKAFLNTVGILKKAQRNSGQYYYCFVGDICENIVRECVADAYGQKVLPHEQVEYIVDTFKSLKGKGLFAVTGNHEGRTRKQAYYDLMLGMCNRLGINYMGIGGYVKLQVGKQTYILAVQHGDTGGSNWEIEMKRMRNNYPDADIYLMGHDHSLHAEYKPYKTIDKFGIEVEGYKIFCRCGSYLGWADYCRTKNYEQKIIGSLKVKFHSDKHLITIDKLMYLNGELIQE